MKTKQDEIKEAIASLKERLSGSEEEKKILLSRIKSLELNNSVLNQMFKEAANEPRIIERLLESLDKLATADPIKIPDAVEVTNHPTEVKVSNLVDIAPKSEVKVSGMDKGFSAVVGAVSGLLEGIKGLTSSVFKASVTGEVRITNNDITEAIPVRLASRDLKYFYDAMFSVLGSGGSSTSDEKLDQIIGLLGGATSVGDGTATVATAGTRVQLSAQACKKVIVQAHESNTGTIVVGGATCVAALSGRRGVALFSTQSQVFEVSNINLLYIDSTANGDIVNYYYEA